MESDEQMTGEGETFMFDIQDTQGFPLIPEVFAWYFNGMPIPVESTNPNVSVYPVIKFNTVGSNDSGNYSMSATSGGKSSNGFFLLNIHCEIAIFSTQLCQFLYFLNRQA